MILESSLGIEFMNQKKTKVWCRDKRKEKRGERRGGEGRGGEARGEAAQKHIGSEATRY